METNATLAEKFLQLKILQSIILFLWNVTAKQNSKIYSGDCVSGARKPQRIIFPSLLRAGAIPDTDCILAVGRDPPVFSVVITQKVSLLK